MIKVGSFGRVDTFHRAMEWLLAIAVLVALLLSMNSMAAAEELKVSGSVVTTLEKADDGGELYASAFVLLDVPLTKKVGVVIGHEQAATWGAEGFPKLTAALERKAEWDVALALRPGDGFSLSIGRRWPAGVVPSDYGGPYNYVQLWLGF